MRDVFAGFAELRKRITEAPERVRIAGVVGNRSGLMWGVSIKGALAVLKTLAGGPQNPSQIYRIHAANSPDKVALRFRGRATTFGELDARMDRVAAALLARGLGRRSSIVLMMKNRPEFLELQSAASRIGGAAVSVSWRSTADELAYLTRHSGSQMICFEDELWPAVEGAAKKLGIPGAMLVSINGTVKETASYADLLTAEPVTLPPIDPEKDGAVVIYTSGTTGKPKGAVRKFPRDALPAALRFIAETPMRVDDVHLVTCPLYHSTAFGFVALSHILGAEVVIMDEFKPEHFLRDVATYKVTTTAMVPTMIHRVLQLGEAELKKHDTSSLRCIFSGGAPLPGPLATAAMDQLGDVVFNFYGATETGLVTLAKPADLRACPSTIGRPIPGNDIRLLDDAGREVEKGKVGELFVKNNLLVAGYHKDEGATNDSMKDGYFSVGDLARVDRDGRYFIEGRKRDMIISGGVNVYPAEVEGVLEEHPGVAEVAVVGVTDQEWGERVEAVVVRNKTTHTDMDDKTFEGELKTWARSRLSGPKVPRTYVFLERLPRNPTGKVLKRELRQRTAS
ncbi:MAG: AMP-binding protein [Polyangiaceae bacterium]